MKLFLVVVCAMGLACSTRKLETPVAPPNSEATQPQPSPSESVTHPEQSSNCSLTKAQAPLVNGLKVGMTPEEVLAVFPGSKDDPDVHSQLLRPPSPLGVSNFTIDAERLKPKEKFAGIKHFIFNLLDDRVLSLNIGYHGPQYSHVDEFVTKVVKGTNLPPADKWQTNTGMENQLKILTCKDFEVRVFAGGEGGNLNYVSLTDLEANRRLKDRRAKARVDNPMPVPSPTASR